MQLRMSSAFLASARYPIYSQTAVNNYAKQMSRFAADFQVLTEVATDLTSPTDHFHFAMATRSLETEILGTNNETWVRWFTRVLAGPFGPLCTGEPMLMMGVQGIMHQSLQCLGS